MRRPDELTRQHLTDRIFTGLGIPRIALGIPDGSNRSVSEVQREMLLADEVAPYRRRVPKRRGGDARDKCRSPEGDGTASRGSPRRCWSGCSAAGPPSTSTRGLGGRLVHSVLGCFPACSPVDVRKDKEIAEASRVLTEAGIKTAKEVEEHFGTGGRHEATDNHFQLLPQGARRHCRRGRAWHKSQI